MIQAIISAANLDIGRALILAVQKEVLIDEFDGQIQEKIADEESAIKRLLI